jgi:hypothetical protein
LAKSVDRFFAEGSDTTQSTFTVTDYELSVNIGLLSQLHRATSGRIPPRMRLNELHLGKFTLWVSIGASCQNTFFTLFHEKPVTFQVRGEGLQGAGPAAKGRHGASGVGRSGNEEGEETFDDGVPWGFYLGFTDIRIVAPQYLTAGTSQICSQQNLDEFRADRVAALAMKDHV